MKLRKCFPLIDTVQRLGAAYHFENEIGEKLKELKKTSVEEFNDDLCIVFFVSIIETRRI